MWLCEGCAPRKTNIGRRTVVCPDCTGYTSATQAEARRKAKVVVGAYCPTADAILPRLRMFCDVCEAKHEPTHTWWAERKIWKAGVA